MAVDIATLKIVVDATQVRTAAAELGTLSTQGTKVERASTGATVGMGRLNQAMLAMARQATGTHPVVARLADVLFSMALGGAKMTAVLGGLAALGFAYRKLTEDARNAREELERAREVAQSFIIGPSPAQEALGPLLARQRLLVGSLASPVGGGGGLREKDLADLQALNREIAAIRAQLAREAFVGPELDVHARYVAQQELLARRVLAMEDYGPPVPPWFGIDSGTARLTNGQNPLFFSGGTVPQVDMQQVDRFADRLAQRQQQLFQQQQGGSDVFGRAVGFSSIALGGIGLGLSSGNAAFAGVGGALGGFGVAGPAGAIVGGISGIVSGLFEQGRRAQEAQRIWKLALEDFALMFDEITPQIALDRTFKQLSGGFTVEQARAFVAQAQALPGAIDPTGIVEKQIAKFQELLRIYDQNAIQADEMAQAEKRLHDARRDVLQALNSPAGLNLAAYGYSAAGAGATVVTINVSGAGEPAEVARRVEDAFNRRTRRGSNPPYIAPTR